MTDEFKITCWNCSNQWTIEIPDTGSIGYRGDLGKRTNTDRLSVKEWRDVVGVKCSACRQYGNHDFKYVGNNG